MSLIEQAAKRLDELRNAGVSVPAAAAAPAAPVPFVARPEPEEAERPKVTSARVELELARLAEEGLITPNEPRTVLAEQFRLIKRPLLGNVVKGSAGGIDRANLIGVTSALPGEGKSFTSLNLAMSIAMEMDRSVLLVDADVVRPSLPRLLGLKSGPGLLDLLGSPPAEFSRALLRTNVDKLAFLPAGTLHPKAAELLASDAMSSLLEEMAARYPDRVIIFDTPPLLVTTESRVLASRMGQVVFVVRAERTLQSQVTQALATIEACQVKLVLLNGARGAPEGAYGYGSYGYGSYGYGHGEAS